jgi:hypothetical protein
MLRQAVPQKTISIFSTCFHPKLHFKVFNSTHHNIAAMEVHVLDNYYLAITLLITIGYQLFFFAIAFSLKFDKLTGEVFPDVSPKQ